MPSLRDSVITVGTFDGVHLGHRAVLDFLMETARRREGKSTLVTFDPHPRVVVRGATIPLLTTIEERVKHSKEWGLDRFIVIPFTKEFAAVEAEIFVDEILLGKLGMSQIVIGHDHSFGRGGRGNEALLRKLSETRGFDVNSIPAELDSESAVSSSRIRHLIEQTGQVRDAAKLLGYYYGFDTLVVKGSARGKKLGFPTANLDLANSDKIIPLVGVYAVKVYLSNFDDPLHGMMNIGVRPTFDESVLTMEVHIIDYPTSEDLYNRQLRVEFVERLRGEQKFAGIDSLVAQLKLDKERCTQLFLG